MGKSPKPLTILAVGLEPHVIEDLKRRGHTVVTPEFQGLVVSRMTDYDLILGPNCMRFLPGMAQFLDSFIKGARAVTYGGKVKP